MTHPPARARLSVLLFAAAALTGSTCLAQTGSGVSLVGKATLPFACQGVAVQGDYAYVAMDGGLGEGTAWVAIINVADPAAPFQEGLYVPGGSFHPTRIQVDGTRAYVGSTRPDLRVLDVADPTYPQLAAQYEEYAQDVELSGGYLYLAALTQGLVILDVSQPAAITEVGYYEPSNDAYGIEIAGSVAYLAYGADGIRIVSVAQPLFPVELGTLDTPGNARDVQVVGTRAFVADLFGGLRIVDVSDPGAPAELGHFPADTAVDPVGFADVLVNGDYAYIAELYQGIRVIDIANPSTPVEAGRFDTNTVGYGAFGVNALTMHAGLVYAAGPDGLYILRPNVPTAVEETAGAAARFRLLANYPNPFNSGTVIRYQLPAAGQADVRVFDILGRQVRTLADGLQAVGPHEVQVDAGGLAAGVYFCQLRFGSQTETIRMVLAK